MVLQISKATGWDYYVGSAGMTSICEDLHAGDWKRCPLLHHRFPVVEPRRSPATSMVQDQSRGSCKVTHCAGVGASVPPGFSFLTRKARDPEETSPHGTALSWERGK